MLHNDIVKCCVKETLMTETCAKLCNCAFKADLDGLNAYEQAVLVYF